MRSLRYFVLAFLAVGALAAGQPLRSPVPRTVMVPSGTLRLKALLWTPAGASPFPAVLFSHGSGSGDPQHTGKFEITSAARMLGPIFAKRGYVFLYLFRRGQGLSSDQGPFMQDVLKREEEAGGKEARKRRQLILLAADHLDDVMAGLSFLKGLSEVDASRIAAVGHSFGGQLTLMAAERDSSLRAAVAFGAAAASWDGSPELRERLLSAVRRTNAPVMLIHAANDYSVAPGRALAAEMARLGKVHVLKIYPPVGRTPDDGHDAVYTAVTQWAGDVFRFLDEHLRH